MRIEMNDVKKIYTRDGQTVVLFEDDSIVFSDGLFYYYGDTIPSYDFSGEEKHREYAEDDYDFGYDFDDNLSDVEADAMTLRDAGWGTDEDYGYYGEDEY